MINECIASARVEGRSRTFVHAAIVSSEIRVVVKHPNELEVVLGGDDVMTRETDEIITNQELSRLTLRYEEVYKNFYHVKTCLDQLGVSHYVIRRKMSVSEFDVIQYDDTSPIVLEKRQRSLIERIFGDGKDHIPVTALIIVADLLMPFVSESAMPSPHHSKSPRRTRSHSDFSSSRDRDQRSVMYEIDLGCNKSPPATAHKRSSTDVSCGYRHRTVSMSDDEDSVTTKRVRYKRNSSLRNITVTRTRSSTNVTH